MSSADSVETALILVPEIRDYERINLEIVARLSSGFRRILLQGVEGQRLLVSGITGDWDAIVIVQGRAEYKQAWLEVWHLTILDRDPRE